ncbi:MAG: polyribonucleotide nucleotidyltransferase [Anaerolineales bacterium]
MLEEHSFTVQLGEHEVELATGKLAGQAGGAVTVRSGDTVLLATATMSRSPREGIDFFPLTVDFEGRLYAAGRIPGSFFRREGRPSEKAILTMRLIDRSIRPLFPKNMRNEVQIIIVALSQGEEQHSDILGLLGASAALTISDISFDGPIAAVRIGYIDGELQVNPTISEMEESSLDLVIAGSEDAIIMVEAGAQEVEESLMLDALELAHKSIQGAIQTQKEMREQVGKPKRDYPFFGTPEGLQERVRSLVEERLKQVVAETTIKGERNEALNALEEELQETLAAEMEERDWSKREVGKAFHEVQKSVVRERILSEGLRPDGRSPHEIRSLAAEVSLVPRPHGSGLFTRGETQVLSLVTLGMPSEEQQLDDLFPEETKRYIHHYNFPPYSTGETWFLRGPKRREIGHGALAERALEPVLPTEEQFPYTIRVVSEVMSSNGSTSMASACASTLALMDAGVPITAPVGGIAMGLVSDGERYRVLTDIQGMEDHLGDMDFKVTGTREGITALQMDIKIKGVTREILSQALDQARDARLQIIDVIEQTLPEPRAELSPSAPRMLTTQIDPDKIGTLIGPGGKNIRAIQADYKVNVDVEENGTVYVASEGKEGRAEEALAYIDKMMEEAKEGKIYTGKVVRTTDFGAFVEVLPGTDGMVHISQLADRRVDSVQDVVNVGDEILVMVTGISPEGKIRLSRQAVLEGWTLEEAKANDRPQRSSGGRGRGRRRS